MLYVRHHIRIEDAKVNETSGKERGSWSRIILGLNSSSLFY